MRATWAVAVWLLATGCGTEVVHGLNEVQANQVAAVLAEHGVPAEKVREEGGKADRWAVSVPADEHRRALEVMRENGLPKSSGRGLADVFPKASLIPTPTEERAMMMQAVMGELERTLETIDGVTLARVHVVIPSGGDTGYGSRQDVAASAAVLLKARPDSSIDRAAVKRLVARGVENLREDSVAVEVFTGAARTVQTAGGVIRVGPLYVHAASAGTLRAAVAMGAALVALMGAGLALLAIRLRNRTAVSGEVA